MWFSSQWPHFSFPEFPFVCYLNLSLSLVFCSQLTFAIASLSAIKAAGRVKEQFLRKIFKYSELNEGEVATYQNLWMPCMRRLETIMPETPPSEKKEG